MKKMSKATVLLIALVIFCQNTAFADTAIDKLRRGLVNCGTGWIELFTTVRRHSDENGYAAGVLFGIPAGIARALWRTGVGVYETATFPIPLPRYYRLIMEPEFVMEDF